MQTVAGRPLPQSRGAGGWGSSFVLVSVLKHPSIPVVLFFFFFFLTNILLWKNFQTHIQAKAVSQGRPHGLEGRTLPAPPGESCKESRQRVRQPLRPSQSDPGRTARHSPWPAPALRRPGQRAAGPRGLPGAGAADGFATAARSSPAQARSSRGSRWPESHGLDVALSRARARGTVG